MEEREYTISKKVSKKYFLEELENNIYNHGDRGFISYKAVSPFENYFWKLLDELEAVRESMDPQEFQEICQAYIDRLENIETDDDWFPEYDIDLVRKLMT